jgi:methylated-DNA-[protein]-cysteine S-methyltransferase
MENQRWLTELQDTPIGPLGLGASTTGLARIALFGLAGLARDGWQGHVWSLAEIAAASQQGLPVAVYLADAVQQLGEYFSGRRRVFDLVLDLAGVYPARQAILQACFAIPFGQVRTYGQLAAEIGKPGAAILVGSAMAANPLPLVIPCHRVVGANRHLHGFGAPGGIATKAWLLEMEGHQIVNQKLA